MALTTDQLTQALQDIQAKVTKFAADKGDADTKTAASNKADSDSAAAAAAATAATSLAAQAKLDEASADSLATADLVDLQTYLAGLNLPAPVVPPVTPAAPTA